MRVKTVPTGWLQIQYEANFLNILKRIRLEIDALKPASAFPFNMSNAYGKGCKKKRGWGKGKAGHLRTGQLWFDF